MGTFVEEQHPRAGGKFAKKGSGAAAQQAPDPKEVARQRATRQVKALIDDVTRLLHRNGFRGDLLTAIRSLADQHESGGKKRRGGSKKGEHRGGAKKGRPHPGARGKRHPRRGGGKAQGGGKPSGGGSSNGSGGAGTIADLKGALSSLGYKGSAVQMLTALQHDLRKGGGPVNLSLERVPGKQNWIERLPAPLRAQWKRSWIHRAAEHLAVPRGTMPVGRAIAVAVNAAKRGCSTGDLNYPGLQQVGAKSRAEMCAAVALWERMKAATKTETSISERDRRVIELAFARIDRDAQVIDLAHRRVGPLRRMRELVRHAIFGERIDLAPSTEERRKAAAKGQAMPSENGGGRFPIRNAAELDKAIRAVGRARPNTEEERRKVRRFIIKRAKALGLSSRIPDTWKADGSLA